MTSINAIAIFDPNSSFNKNKIKGYVQFHKCCPENADCYRDIHRLTLESIHQPQVWGDNESINNIICA